LFGDSASGRRKSARLDLAMGHVLVAGLLIKQLRLVYSVLMAARMIFRSHLLSPRQGKTATVHRTVLDCFHAAVVAIVAGTSAANQRQSARPLSSLQVHRDIPF
jgi:hypothetical protein